MALLSLIAAVIPVPRRRNDWCPPFVDRHLYVRLATELAFRKHQSRICEEGRRESYRGEVARLRGEIRRPVGTTPPDPG